MRTVTLKSVADEVLYAVWKTTSASAERKKYVFGRIEARCREIWEMRWWPELTPIEERAFRDDFDLTATYAAGDEVWDPDGRAYYTSLTAGNTGHELTDADHWAAVANLADLYVALEQTGKPALGEVEGVYPSLDDARKKMLRISTSIEGDRVALLGPMAKIGAAYVPMLTQGAPAVGSTVWVRYRQRPPRFTTEAYAAGSNYPEGWVVYWPDDPPSQQAGNCYMVVADSTTDSGFNWLLQAVPADFAAYIKAAVIADLWRDEQQPANRGQAEAQAAAELDRVIEKIFPQQGIPSKVRVRVR